MTGDLVAWLTAVWDEEERLATAAAKQYTGARWLLSDDVVGADRGGYVACGAYSGDIGEEIGNHIVAHDPASVLARIAADRKILALADEASALDAQVDGEFRVGPRNLKEEPYVGDLILRHLASPYKGREGWQEEWDE